MTSIWTFVIFSGWFDSIEKRKTLLSLKTMTIMNAACLNINVHDTQNTTIHHPASIQIDSWLKFTATHQISLQNKILGYYMVQTLEWPFIQGSDKVVMVIC